MIPNIKSTASELTKNIPLDTTIIMSILQSNVIFAKLIPEMRKFEKRNCPDGRCCPRCLKAHAVRKARDMKLEEKLVSIINNLLESDTGHHGYYLDKTKLIKI